MLVLGLMGIKRRTPGALPGVLLRVTGQTTAVFVTVL
jgi:hypothetical protein